MRSDTVFSSAGLTLRGWLYRPEVAAPFPAPFPAIVMTHGFSAVKEQGLDGFARAFCAAGFVVLAFDCRCLGASEGAERGRIIAQEQHDDLRAALTHVAALSFVDPSRIGLWGSSYSGGHALFLGALDPRVKVVVAQVPALDVARSLKMLAGEEGFAGYLALLAQDHAGRNAGVLSARMPVVAPAGEPSVLATPDSHAWFTKSAVPGWSPTTTLESVARMLEYQPAAFIDLIAPKPLLMVAGSNDSLIPFEQVRAAFARAGEPKKLVELPCGHFDLYPGEAFHAAALDEERAWFVKHLAGV